MDANQHESDAATRLLLYTRISNSLLEINEVACTLAQGGCKHNGCCPTPEQCTATTQKLRRLSQQLSAVLDTLLHSRTDWIDG